MTAEQAYRRLPGRGAKLLSESRQSLWLGEDHLLCIANARFTEDYKRFRFEEIQAFVVRVTSEHRTGNILLAALLVPCAIIAGLAPQERIAAAISAGLIILLILDRTRKGPTCICHLQTAVQTLELTSLRRLKDARKVLDILGPYIEAAQHEMPAGMTMIRTDPEPGGGNER